MATLKINDLHVKTGQFTLTIEHLEMKEGELFGILGHSGAGKSTLLKSIAGLIPIQKGEHMIGDVVMQEKKPHERGIAYVFQEPVLFTHLSVKENLEYLLHVKKTDKALWEDKITYALNSSNASHLMKRMPDTLSGGEKQRVGIATALLFEPKLLIMDEPFAALDPDLRVQMRRFVKKLVKEQKITTLFVTHDKEEAFVLFDRMALLDEGNLLQVGTPKELYEKPNSLKTARYFGIEGIVDGSVKKGEFSAQGIAFKTDASEGSYKAIIPPHALHVKEKGFSAKLISQEYIEGRWKIFLDNDLVLYASSKQEAIVTYDLESQHIHLLSESSC